MNRAQLLQSLEELYLELAARLPVIDGNPCGACRSCCTGGMSGHQVSELELELVRTRMSETCALGFSSYLNRDKAADGGLLHPVCPNYDEEQKGCRIYAVRPFSCRVFGHHLQAGTALPPDCVFESRAAVFAPGEYYVSIPLSSRLRWLTRELQLFRPLAAASSGGSRATDSDFFNADDPIDRAIRHQLAGNLPAALEELLAARCLEPRSNYLHYSLALLYAMQNRHREALESFREVVLEVPRADLHAMAAHHCLALGDPRAAEVELLAALELDPRCSMALGMLAYLHLMENQLEKGAAYLERALREEPDNGFFHLRLGLAWIQLGREQEGLAELLEASRLEPSREQAEQLLAKLQRP